MRKYLLLILSLCSLIANAKYPDYYPERYRKNPITNGYLTYLDCYGGDFIINQRARMGLPNNVKSCKDSYIFISFDKDGKLLQRIADFTADLGYYDTTSYTYHYSKNKIAATVKKRNGTFSFEWNSDSMITKADFYGAYLWTFSYIDKNLLEDGKKFVNGVLVQHDSLIYNPDGSATDYQLRDSKYRDTLTFDKYGTLVRMQSHHPESNFDATSDIQYTFFSDGSLKSVNSLKADIGETFEDPNEVKKRDDNEEGVVYTYY